MLYSDIKTQFLSILNRRDITASQTITFLNMGVQRIQRELRVPPMEKQMDWTCDGTANIPVPGDFLELISIHFADSNYQSKLKRVDLQTALRQSQATGIPKVFYRQTTSFLVGPKPPSGAIGSITYYADATNLSADADHNWLTDGAPDLMIYAGLCYAADFFLDERTDKFEARYAQIAQALQDMATQDELENASISPLYNEEGW